MQESNVNTHTCPISTLVGATAHGSVLERRVEGPRAMVADATAVRCSADDTPLVSRGRWTEVRGEDRQSAAAADAQLAERKISFAAAKPAALSAVYAARLRPAVGRGWAWAWACACARPGGTCDLRGRRSQESRAESVPGGQLTYPRERMRTKCVREVPRRSRRQQMGGGDERGDGGGGGREESGQDKQSVRALRRCNTRSRFGTVGSTAPDPAI
ncbi:hypothetical protein BC628DRAFT_32265 [Trametes gibbosa]|nr:hypothetical protein BC628DRAFT_32265 [Trametes gibbosa]